MELNKNEIDYIINLLEVDNYVRDKNIKKVMGYEGASELIERFDFVNGIINKLRG